MYITNLMASMVLFFPKLSIFFLYRKLFSPNRLTLNLIYCGLALAIATYWSSIPLDTYYCTPRKGQEWNSPAVRHICNKIIPYSIVQGSLNVVLDLYILYIPVPIVRALQLSPQKRAGVIFVFMHGVLYVRHLPLSTPTIKSPIVP